MPKKKPLPPQHRQVITLRTKGYTYQEIADHLGISRMSVYLVVKKSAPQLIRSRSEMATVRSKRATLINVLRARGKSWAEIARRLGMSPQSLSMWKGYNSRLINSA